MIADHFLQLRTDVEAALIGLLRLVAEIKQDATAADHVTMWRPWSTGLGRTKSNPANLRF